MEGAPKDVEDEGEDQEVEGWDLEEVEGGEMSLCQNWKVKLLKIALKMIKIAFRETKC